uniref:HSF-type DNA-binding domain-containing protein n=1 Tax=Oryza barthii TaxID=65489 RepID=A0A0D3FAP7_9ORYZ
MKKAVRTCGWEVRHGRVQGAHTRPPPADHLCHLSLRYPRIKFASPHHHPLHPTFPIFFIPAFPFLHCIPNTNHCTTTTSIARRVMTTTTAEGGGGVAPFVAKTYRMVDDPATDGVIAWGRDRNSFVVADPFAFSQTLLPAHFKHSNFSSFVRQLNTYGFRKVDPDRWEFAHVSFLRGQTHLLRRIVRRSSGGGGAKRKEEAGGCGGGGEAAAGDVDEESALVAMEVARLRREQREIEGRVAAMWRRPPGATAHGVTGRSGGGGRRRDSAAAGELHLSAQPCSHARF